MIDGLEERELKLLTGAQKSKDTARRALIVVDSRFFDVGPLSVSVRDASVLGLVDGIGRFSAR